jgi:hypothetical protein
MDYLLDFALFCAGIFVGFLIFKGNFKSRAAVASVLEDNAGGLSSMRAAMLAWLAALGATWVFVAIATRSLPDIPAGVLTFTGMLVGGKVVQRFGEKPEEPEIQTLRL